MLIQQPELAGLWCAIYIVSQKNTVCRYDQLFVEKRTFFLLTLFNPKFETVLLALNPPNSVCKAPQHIQG